MREAIWPHQFKLHQQTFLPKNLAEPTTLLGKTQGTQQEPTILQGAHQEPTILHGKTHGTQQEPTILLRKTQGTQPFTHWVKRREDCDNNEYYTTAFARKVCCLSQSGPKSQIYYRSFADYNFSIRVVPRPLIELQRSNK